jgi:hypothetical protein
MLLITKNYTYNYVGENITLTKGSIITKVLHSNMLDNGRYYFSVDNYYTNSKEPTIDYGFLLNIPKEHVEPIEDPVLELLYGD